MRYDGGSADLEITPGEPDRTRLCVSVIGAGQIPTAYLDFTAVNTIYHNLGEWLIETRAKMPLRVGDTYDELRPVVNGTVMITQPEGQFAFVFRSDHWWMTGTDVEASGTLNGARVIYVPEQT